MAVAAGLVPAPAYAAEAPAELLGRGPLLWGGLVLAAVALTSFAKSALVLGLLRSAFGVNGVPSATLTTALAALLTFGAMAPLLLPTLSSLADSTQAEAAPILERWTSFWTRNADAKHLESLAKWSTELRAEGAAEAPAWLPFWETWPPALAFVLTELEDAFRVGVWILLPFVILDIAATLLVAALGWTPPAFAALLLPLKLALFLAVDGWRVLSDALLRGYTF